MAAGITYLRRSGDEVLTTLNIAELLPDWKGTEERWLFVAPHDDDIVCGAGLTLQAGLAEGARVHALVVTDGRMGYCRPEHQHTIANIRMAEAKRSFEILGLSAGGLRQLSFPDGNLETHRGRCFNVNGCATAIEGAMGLQNSFTHALRQIRPNRIFLATSSDLHPDHRVVHEEMLISLFHAQGKIWPELGEPIAEVPQVYEYAVYCDFPSPPQIRIETPPAMLEVKLDAIRAYASQEQIETVVQVHRDMGPIEYIRELHFHFYSPQQYHQLFGKT
jgi:LmbE family N-acetylglucosaminyl deacetylase